MSPRIARNFRFGRIACRVIMLSVILTGCNLEIVLDPRTREVGNFEAFLKAVEARDDTQAKTYLSQNAQAALIIDCPNGSTIACIDKMGLQSWGKLQEVYWVYGISDGESAYTTIWDNDVIHIIVISHQTNGHWEIDGWRGGVPAKAGWPDGLLNGTAPINQFPATQ